MQHNINGMKVEMHLCTACSMALVETPINFENLLQGVMNSILSVSNAKANAKTPAPAMKCETCGMTGEQFKANGKLGCAACYRTFSKELEAVLKNVQGSVRHEGKFPKRSGLSLRKVREADRLRVLLRKAVDAENFEEAASLRDRIKEMKQKEEAQND